MFTKYILLHFLSVKQNSHKVQSDLLNSTKDVWMCVDFEGVTNDERHLTLAAKGVCPGDTDKRNRSD